jgi:hypothetical protein
LGKRFEHDRDYGKKEKKTKKKKKKTGEGVGKAVEHDRAFATIHVIYARIGHLSVLIMYF